jgi:hypothetical protein
LVVADVKERLAVSKGSAQKIVTGSLNLEKLNEGDVKDQYQVTIRRKFAALKNLEGNRYINKSWKNTSELIKISAEECLDYCEPEHRKEWCDKACSKLVDRRKQDKYSCCRTQAVGMKAT